MKRSFLLVCLFLYTVISRFWHIGTVPAVASGAVLFGRYGTGFASCLTLLSLYCFVRWYSRSTRTALLAVWVFAVSPWAVEQGRIFSPLQIFTPILLLLIWTAQLIRFKLLRIMRYVSIAVATVAFYWVVWEFQKDTGIASFSSAFSNLFALFSPSMLFVSNTTFWWGGVREFGMLFLSFAPFFVLGLLDLISKKQWMVLGYVVLFGMIASIAPQFPEGRQFYPALPFLSYITAAGLRHLHVRSQTVSLILLCMFLMIWVYEDIQFWHFYATHYSQQVREATDKIVVPF